MKYAIISDIHTNLPAPDAVLEDIATRPNLNTAFHCGDLVGYVPWPNETVDVVRKAGIAGIAGNYDSTVATDVVAAGGWRDE